jgi:hypothetical protein
MGRGRVLRSAAALGFALVLLASTQAQAQPGPMTKFIGGKGIQDWPGANNSYIAWSQNKPGSTQRYDAWVRDLPLGSDTPVRLNKSGYEGYMGGISQDSNEAIFEQWSPRTGGDLVIVDLANPTVPLAVPAGINTARWSEGAASISNNFILYMRWTLKYQYVYLYDRNTHATTRLMKASIKCNCYADAVTDRYATWTKSTKTRSNTYYYDTTKKQTHAFPSVAAPFVYGGVISDATGFWYAIKSGNGCGARPRIVRYLIGSGSPPTTVAAFPPNVDTYGVGAVVNDPISMNDTLYLPGLSCNSRNSDVYEVTMANK